MKRRIELCAGSPDIPTERQRRIGRVVSRIKFGLAVLPLLTVIAAGVVFTFGIDFSTGAETIGSASLMWLAVILLHSAVAMMAMWMYTYHLPWCHAERFRRAFWRAFMEVPNELHERATRLYGFNLDAHLSAIECHEAHAPGDCPLCGAE